MKKALIASTALVLSAGVAAADVTISGYGRTGVIYTEDQAGNETRISSRVRFNIDASTSTDNGVDFGARVRLQWDQGESTAGDASPAYLYVTASGLTVYVGNVPTAYDSVNLMYAPELGAFDRSAGGTPTGSFYAFSTNGYGANNERVGVAVEYSVDDLTVRASYVDPDQTGLVNDNEEFGLSVDYTWNDRLELAAAFVQDGNGVKDNDQFFVGARYAVLDNARIGLNYIDNGTDIAGDSIVLYGDYTLADGLTNIEAYVANNDGSLNDTDNSFGVGVNYDLGGARLGASIQRGYDKKVTADLGVRFDF